MNGFEIEPTDAGLHLALPPETTVEHAADLHATLAAAVGPELELVVDASATLRLDAAALQVLVAAARAARAARVESPSPAWHAAFSRYALPDPFAPATAPLAR